jgi:Mrp family chromosome partitioning ATPase
VIGVVSGKGGVGKSFVTAMLAVLMNRKGYGTGILDADITGPSIPKMFGIGRKAQANELGILPERTHNDIRIMSINLLLPQTDARSSGGGRCSRAPSSSSGPTSCGVISTFFLSTCRRGRGDVPLTVFQSIPLDGIVVVTSPQELVSMIVKKACNMAAQMDIPVLGIVENMSYIKCPDCGKEIRLFGDSSLPQTAKDLGLKVLGRVPVDPVMAQLSDRGEFEKFSNDYLSGAAEEIENLFFAAK